jgi:hypothetical protein
MFGLDEIGSSQDPCSETYRGPSAFSEPETSSIRDFVTIWSNIKVAINMHAYGNLLIHPFNYDTKANNYLHDQFPLADKFYKNLYDNGGVLDLSVTGNGATTIGYTANGEASDWMLQSHDVYSLSPELGTMSTRTANFFIKNPNDIKSLVKQNYGWITYAAAQLLP